MARVIHRFDPPERFVAGTVGEPGQRTFYLQARSGHRLCSVALEKEQVSVLAERLESLLDAIVLRTGGQADVPAVPATGSEDVAPLELPLEEEFRVGTLTLAWDASDARIVIEAIAVGPDPDEPPEPGAEAAPPPEPGAEPAPQSGAGEDPADERDVLQVRIGGAAARSFVARARALVAAGRPACPLCAQPLDPGGHVCPRQNGYRRRA